MERDEERRIKMKLLILLFIFLFRFSEGMDSTPPPQYKIGEHEPTWEPIPRVPVSDDISTTIHRTHSVKTIHATVENNTGKDLEINAVIDEEKDSETHQVTRRTLIISNGCTAIITACIGAGVTLAVKYGENCK